MEDMQAKIGQLLLPALLRITKAASDWLGKTENQQRVVRALKQAFSLLGAVLDTVRSAYDKLKGPVTTLVEQLGGMKNTLKLLAGAFVGYKVGMVAASVANAAFGASGVGALTAIKAALISTGIGALFVALGVAAVLIMQHWDKVGPYFKLLFQGLMGGVKVLVGYFLMGMGLMGKALGEVAHLAAKAFGWVPGIGGKLKKAANEFGDGLEYMFDTGRKLAEGGGKDVWGAFKGAWDQAQGSDPLTLTLPQATGGAGPLAARPDEGTRGASAPGLTGNEGTLVGTAKRLGPSSGRTYVFGTATDCSGYVKDIYSSIGISLPHNAAAMWARNSGSSSRGTVGEDYVSPGDLRPGDAVFYVGADGSSSAPGHVAVYVGGGQIIEYYTTGKTAHYNSVNRPGYVGAKRWYLVKGSHGSSAPNRPSQPSGAAPPTPPSGMPSGAKAPKAPKASKIDKFGTAKEAFLGTVGDATNREVTHATLDDLRGLGVNKKLMQRLAAEGQALWAEASKAKSPKQLEKVERDWKAYQAKLDRIAKDRKGKNKEKEVLDGWKEDRRGLLDEVKDLSGSGLEGIQSALGFGGGGPQITEAKANQAIRIINTFKNADLGSLTQGAYNKLKASAEGAKNTLGDFYQQTADNVQGMVDGAKEAFGRYRDGVLDKFDDETNATLKSMQKGFAASMKAFEAETKSGLDRIRAQFAGDTPAEAELKALQSAHDATEQASRLAEAQQGLAAARASGDPNAIAEAQKSLDEVLYEQKVDALQKRADAERTARDQAQQEASDAYQAQRDAQAQALQDQEADREEAYQRQRDQQRQLVDDNLARQEQGWELSYLGQQSDWGSLIGWLNRKASGWNEYWTWLNKNIGPGERGEISVGANDNPEFGQGGTAPARSFTGRGGRITGVQEFATGGIVMRETYARIGEAGPEAVIPLSQLSRYAPQPLVINVTAGTFIGTDKQRAARELTELVRPELLRLQGRNGSTGIS